MLFEKYLNLNTLEISPLTPFNSMPHPFNMKFDTLNECYNFFRYFNPDYLQNTDPYIISQARNRLYKGFSEPLMNFFLYHKMLIDSGNHPDYKHNNLHLNKRIWIGWEHEMLGILWFMGKLGRLSTNVLKSPKELRAKMKSTEIYEDMDFRYPEYKKLLNKIQIIGELIYEA